MWDWLISPIDPERVHAIGFAVSWHGRLMVLGWGMIAPLAILAARYFKILPGQDWPNVLDTQLWWRLHWIGQSVVFGLSSAGVVLILWVRTPGLGPHGWLGYSVILLLVAQVGLGLFRGTKGGPTAPARDGSFHGDHYDMTRWRLAFEATHKAIGYGVLVLAACTILFGMWEANAPVWMWLALAVWWPLLIFVFVVLQRRGMAVDTYQAIWGADPIHPGNRRPKQGWGMRRPGDHLGRDSNVRDDRGHGLRNSRPEVR